MKSERACLLHVTSEAWGVVDDQWWVCLALGTLTTSVGVADDEEKEVGHGIFTIPIFWRRGEGS